MAISCSCDYDYGVFMVGDPKEVTCRTPRQCDACNTSILVLDKMYMLRMFDFTEIKTVAPVWLCEECGDMALNLWELEFCFSLNENIRQQWLDYLHDVEPNNPAVTTSR